MSIQVPSSREFDVLRRGEARERMLDYFRSGLLELANPETGELFTQDEVARATAKGSRWHNEASAIDDLVQGDERRALFLAQQGNPLTASTWWLESLWAPMLSPGGRLPAGRAGGSVTVAAPQGTTIVGSTTVPDETAYWGYVGAVRVQVLVGGAVPAPGTLAVVCIAIDAGVQGNFAGGETLTWSNRDPSMAPEATVVDDWSGGAPIESDNEWARRMVDSLAYKQGGGNDAQQRAWAKSATTSVLEAFIYPCYARANSFMVAVTQKRDRDSTGPDDLQPNDATLSEVVATMVPPGAPNQSAIPMVLVTGFVPEPVDVAVHMDLAVGSSDGFSDVVPWPTNVASAYNLPRVTTVGSNYVMITATNEDSLPGEDPLAAITSGFPSMLAWDEDTSTWVPIVEIVSMVDSGSHVFRINFDTLPTWAIEGAAICPAFAPTAAAAAQDALRSYFDGLGPGELFNLATDPRGGRCVRFPDAADEYPYRAGSAVGTVVRDAIGGIASSDVAYLSQSAPTYATDLSLGPNKLTLGQAGVYPLT